MEMKTRIVGKFILFHDSMLKAELYSLIKLNKPKYRQYPTDRIFAECGYSMPRLSPHLPDLNPIELIWTGVKQWFGGKNTTFNVKDVEQM
jgi:hypothetical protein